MCWSRGNTSGSKQNRESGSDPDWASEPPGVTTHWDWLRWKCPTLLPLLHQESVCTTCTQLIWIVFTSPAASVTFLFLGAAFQNAFNISCLKWSDGGKVCGRRKSWSRCSVWMMPVNRCNKRREVHVNVQFLSAENLLLLWDLLLPSSGAHVEGSFSSVLCRCSSEFGHINLQYAAFNPWIINFQCVSCPWFYRLHTNNVEFTFTLIYTSVLLFSLPVSAHKKITFSYITVVNAHVDQLCVLRLNSITDYIDSSTL